MADNRIALITGGKQGMGFAAGYLGGVHKADAFAQIIDLAESPLGGCAAVVEFRVDGDPI